MTEALTFDDFPEQLPDPSDQKISELDFTERIDRVWQVCDRFDLQTDIWRGRVLRVVRDRQKENGDGQGVGFLNWLKDHEISKSQAYTWITLAESADVLIKDGLLDEESVDRFSKRAFVETAQTAPEVQLLVSEAARNGENITRREVRLLSDEWTAMNSDLLPAEVKAKAAENLIPTRYLAPFVREIEKIPESQRAFLQESVANNPDLDTLKSVTAEAQRLARYLSASNEVQAISEAIANGDLNLELALEESLRLGCLKSTADLVNYAAQMEQTAAKFFTIWKRLNLLAEQVYVETGASTPHLRSLLNHLETVLGDQISIHIATKDNSRLIQIQIQEEIEE